MKNRFGVARWLLLTLGGLAAITTAASSTSSGCPDKCSCKWKGGKEWVECANRELEGLPQGAREETQVLDLSGNQLYSLMADGFFVLRLVNLQKLYLARSQLRQVASKAFVGLQGLVELDLSDNELQSVPSESFASVPYLMRLSLAGNPLGELRSKAFAELGQLGHLDLSRCHIESIEPGAFAGLHSLEWLRLNDNELRHVLAPEALPSPTTGGLHGVPLHNNPWRCDCGLVELQTWLRQSAQQAPQESEPKCAQPARLASRTIRSLKAHELACAPEIRLPERIDVYEGDNASLVCEVSAQPRANVVWLLNGQPLEPGASGDRDNVALSAAALAEDSARYTYSYSEHSGDDRISASLEITEARTQDEGSYTCQAENAAGISLGNVSLRILRRERSTLEPPIETPSTGYAAAIAAGALLGTLLALGCLFLGIFLYARRLRSGSKNTLKQPPPPTSIVPPSILKKTTAYDGSGYKSASIALGQPTNRSCSPALCGPGGQQEHLHLGPGGTGEFTEMAYLQSQLAPQRSFIEPDLICNEGGGGGGQAQTPPLPPPPSAYSNCLDRDGYPLNFGLPKIGTLPRGPRIGACETLPRGFGGARPSAALPLMRYSREAEFLARSAYPPHPLLEVGYAAVVPAPFIPSPPAGYRGNEGQLSPRPLLGGAAAAEPGNAVGLPAPPPEHHRPESAQHLHGLEHPESPDEGYVGDAMDV